MGQNVSFKGQAIQFLNITEMAWGGSGHLLMRTLMLSIAPKKGAAVLNVGQGLLRCLRTRASATAFASEHRAKEIHYVEAHV